VDCVLRLNARCTIAESDPRVPSSENILPFSQRLQHAGVPLKLNRMEANTHGSQELFVRYTPEIVAFL
jgi:hypothetical protein